MFDDKQVYLHIGFMKTGTTSLQNSVFPHCKDLAYFGKPFAPLAPTIRSITMLDADRWTDALSSIKEELSVAFLSCGSRVLISEEEFSVGGEINSPADRTMIAARLHQLFPHATIVLVIRNQFAALQSLYAYVMSLADRYLPFNSWLASQREFNVPARGLDVFDYDALVQSYGALFPRERVRILLYEKMVAKYDSFARSLAAALDCDADAFASIGIGRQNVRPCRRKVIAVQFWRRNPWLAQVLRWLPNPVVHAVGKFIEHGPPIDVRYCASNHAFVHDRFAASNRRLANYLQIDLSQWGYPCQ